MLLNRRSFRNFADAEVLFSWYQFVYLRAFFFCEGHMNYSKQRLRHTPHTSLSVFYFEDA